jgi:glycosyltransferase involved in cell wall biosynthesis
LRILVAHNRYQQAGGEDTVVALEMEMLSRRGHDVELLATDNHAIVDSKAQVLAALRSFYSRPSYDLTTEKIKSFRPDILHIHNIVPGLSPSIYYAANAADIPVVQTLHNYRLVCANGQLFRDGRPCEECVTSHSFLPGVKHACYRNSHMGSAVVGAGTAVHSALGTWQQRVDRYIVLSKFAASMLGGTRVPLDKMRVKPNFTVDRGAGAGDGGYALFVGRLSKEKGLETLLEADAMGKLALPVYIVGGGPMLQTIEAACAMPGSQLRYLGYKSGEEVFELMKRASALLAPSIWYEGFPMVIVEALSFGVPIIASRIGSLPEIIDVGVSGLLHNPGDAAGIAEAVRWVADNSVDVAAMRQAARNRYLNHYSEEQNYCELLKIYGEVTH